MAETGDEDFSGGQDIHKNSLLFSSYSPISVQVNPFYSVEACNKLLGTIIGSTRIFG
jgi:hypothetical protein